MAKGVANWSAGYSFSVEAARVVATRAKVGESEEKERKLVQSLGCVLFSPLFAVFWPSFVVVVGVVLE